MARGEINLAVLTRTRQGEGKIQDRGTQIILWVVIVAFAQDRRVDAQIFPGRHAGEL